MLYRVSLTAREELTYRDSEEVAEIFGQKVKKKGK